MDEYAVDDNVSRIVSFRLKHDEYRKLTRWSRESGMTMSSMLRQLFTQLESPFKKIDPCEDCSSKVG